MKEMKEMIAESSSQTCKHRYMVDVYADKNLRKSLSRVRHHKEVGGRKKQLPDMHALADCRNLHESRECLQRLWEDAGGHCKLQEVSSSGPEIAGCFL